MTKILTKSSCCEIINYNAIVSANKWIMNIFPYRWYHSYQKYNKNINKIILLWNYKSQVKMRLKRLNTLYAFKLNHILSMICVAHHMLNVIELNLFEVEVSTMWTSNPFEFLRFSFRQRQRQSLNGILRNFNEFKAYVVNI